jgi:ankyrin repeat protein
MCKAAATGDIGYVTSMVQHGVDPNVTDYAGSTPLHILAADDQPEAVEIFVEHGADILATDRSVYALPTAGLSGPGLICNSFIDVIEEKNSKVCF